jgi:Uma2 family endonuclease
MITAVTRKKFTVEEYHRLIDIGLFIEGNRIELIRGDIIEMPAKRTPHSVCNSLLLKELYKLLGDRAMIRGQEPIILPPDSEPEPDVVIARPKNDNYLSSSL